MPPASHDVDEMFERLRGGDMQALAELFAKHRGRLFQIVSNRLDRRLYGRLDADDILQEAYLDASDRIQHYVNSHSGSFFVWLRLITMQTMSNVYRRHLDAQRRDATREQSIFTGRHYGSGLVSLARQLMGKLTSPSGAAMRDETARDLEAAVNRLNPIDREVLTLRHFEQLDNKEVAEVLGIKTKAASIRYIRAVARLKNAIADIPGIAELLDPPQPQD